MALLIERDEPPSMPIPENREEWNVVFQRAGEGDLQARALARAILDKYPGTMTTSWSRQARRAVITSITGEDLWSAEILYRDAQRVHQRLAGPSPSPLEALLAERIVVCWLQVNQYETVVAAALKKGVRHDDWLRQQRLLNLAQRRYLSAIKALAQVRRLQLPAVQINLADQQINLGEQQINIAHQQNTATGPAVPGQ